MEFDLGMISNLNVMAAETLPAKGIESGVELWGAILVVVFACLMLIRTAGYIVLGESLTWGSSLLALVASGILSGAVRFLGYGRGSQEMGLGVAVVVFVVHAVLYKATLRGRNGSGASIGQSMLILVVQWILIAILVAAVIAIWKPAGFSWESLRGK